MQPVVIISHLEDAAKAFAQAEQLGHSQIVVYLGKDVFMARELRCQAPDILEFREIGADLTKLALKHKDIAVVLDKSMGQVDYGSPYWNASTLSIRSLQVGDFLLRTLGCQIVMDILRKEHRDVLVLVDDWNYAASLLKVLGDADCTVRYLEGTYANRRRLSKKISAFRKIQCRQMWSCRIEFVRTFIKRKKNLRNRYSGKNLRIKNLVVGYVSEGMQSKKDLCTTDSNYGLLLTKLGLSHRNCGVVGIPLLGSTTFSGIVAAAESHADYLILGEAVCSLKDVFQLIISSFFWKMRLPKRVDFNRLNIRNLLLDQMREDRADRRMLDSLYYYKLGKCLGERLNQLETVVQLYENLPAEKCFRLGIRKSAPQVKMVGFQQAPIPDLMLGMFLSQDELGAGITPDVALVTGEWWKIALQHQEMHHCRLVECPSYRYIRTLQQGRDFTAAAGRRSGERIFAVCPGQYYHASDFIFRMLEAFGQETGVKVRFKFHPTSGPKTLQSLERALNVLGYAELPEHFEVTEEGIEDCLKNTDLVITATSTVVLEALAFHVPVLEVDLEQNIVISALCYADPEMRVKAGNPEEIRKKSLEILSRDDWNNPVWTRQCDAVTSMSFYEENEQDLILEF